MLDKTVYDREFPSNPSAKLILDSTNERIKTSCYSCISHSLYLENNDLLQDIFHTNPARILLDDCITFSGKAVKSKIVDKALEELFMGSDDREFYELLENAAHCIFENEYHYDSFEKSLNVVFLRNSIGFRCFDGRFIISLEPRMFDQVISPCFHILASNGFDAADENLKNAFSSLRDERFEDAIVNSSKAIESVLDKLLIDNDIPRPEKGNDYHYKITKLVEGGMLPRYVSDATFELLQFPIRIRNKAPNVSHGSSVVEADILLATYVVDMTCSSILFIVRSLLS